MNKIPVNELYNTIKDIWEREYELSDAIQMGSKIVNFVKTHKI